MQREEQISAFLDGELSGSESHFLLRQLGADKEGREQFDRYSLVGEVLRGSTPPVMDLGLTDRIMAEIAADPASNMAPVAVPSDPVVLPIGAGLVASGIGSPKQVSWARPLVSLAMAASVALVAIVLWPNALPKAADSVQVAAIAPTTSIIEVPAQNVVLTATAERAPEAKWELADPEVRRRLSEYVAGYSQFSSAPTGQHSAPFVQSVGLQGRGIINDE